MRKEVITIKRKLFVPGIAIFIMLGISIASLNAVSAQEVSSYPPIVQKLAERFNLNPSEVEDVFQEMHEERQADMHAQFEERLNDLVSEGKLTEEQKLKVLDKIEEMQTKMESLRDLNPEERRQESREMHEEMRKWFEDSGINFEELRFMVKLPGRGFEHKMIS
jgi:hypothetical protein